MTTYWVTANDHNGLYQYIVDGRPTDVPAKPITSATDPEAVAQLLGLEGHVDHDDDCVFVTTKEHEAGDSSDDQ